MKTDRELALKVLGKYLGQIKERDVLALDLLVDENPKAKVAKPEDFVDNRFIKELDDSGYIDSLYKTKLR